MATHVFVVDASFKRTQVKVTPGTYLRAVLEEACKSRKLNPEEYSLKSPKTNKTLDLSQPFRLSGLSAGAKLQLTQASKSPGVVSVALQLPENEGATRLSDKFPSTTSLWLLLRKYEDAVAGGGGGKKLNLTQRGVPSNSSGAGRLVYEQPCLNLLGRNLETFADLQKTLAQLGLNGGTVLIRLSFKATQTPLEEAMREFSEFFASIDDVAGGSGSSASQGREGASAAANGTVESLPAADAADSAEPVEAETEREPPSDTPITDAPPTEPSIPTSSPPPTNPPPSDTINNISVYRPPTSSTPAAALQPDDPAVYEPTIDHAKSHQAALQAAGKNQRLLSDAELAEQEKTRAQRLAAVQSVQVRVRYPDQSQIEMTVYPSETGADLYGKVMDTLAAAPEPFELKLAGAKGGGMDTVPNSASTRLVRDLGFRGKVLVTLVWGQGASERARAGPCLKEEYLALARDLRVELVTQQVEGERGHEVAMKREEEVGRKGEGKGKGTAGDVEAKMKRFLGFGKK